MTPTCIHILPLKRNDEKVYEKFISHRIMAHEEKFHITIKKPKDLMGNKPVAFKDFRFSVYANFNKAQRYVRREKIGFRNACMCCLVGFMEFIEKCFLPLTFFFMAIKMEM